MPVEVVSGNIFEDNADVLVIPVNCVGVMGAGLAKEAKRRWPEMYAAYRHDCNCRVLTVGIGVGYRTSRGEVYCLPTKVDWRNPSQIGWIRAGLEQMVSDFEDCDPLSFAIPALGCGLGGLDFADVLPLIVYAFKGTDYDVRVYRPR